MTSPRKKVSVESVWEEILEGLAQGKSLTSICEPDDMPMLSSVVVWQARDPERSQAYTRAREIGAEATFEEIQSIADGVEPDKDAVAKARVQIDTRKWQMSKVAPKRYGDKIAIDHQHSIEGMDADDLRAALSDLLKKGS